MYQHRPRSKKHGPSIDKKRKPPSGLVLSRRRIRRTQLSARSTIGKLDHARKGLVDLPGELRNQIYDYALRPTLHQAIRITAGAMPMSSDLALGLLGTCKAVLREALLSLYCRNSFRIDIAFEPDVSLNELVCSVLQAPI